MNRSKVVLLGSSSFTGSAIYTSLSDKYEFVRINRTGLNSEGNFDVIKDSVKKIECYLKDANVVINCISNGDVDSCEEDPVGCGLINLDFVKDLCFLQAQFGFQLINFSSNAVYDGENPLYTEESEAKPINRYGEIKCIADEYVESNIDNFTIFRPITMFGTKMNSQRHNPFSFFWSRISEHQDIVAVDDVYVNMLHVADLVSAIKTSIDKKIVGTFNISGDDIVNRYEFASMILKLVPESKSRIRRVSSAEFPTAAKRPLNTSFDNSEMKSVLGVLPQKLEKTLEYLVASEFKDKKAAA